MSNFEELKRLRAMVKIQQLSADLESDGLIRTQGLLWFALTDLLMGEENTAPLMVELMPVFCTWQAAFDVWREGELDRIKRDVKPRPGGALDQMIQKATDWPEAFE